MKRLSTLLFSLVMVSIGLHATDHTIVTSGLSYSPSDLVASVGDNVTIVATGNHPTTEVSEDTWNANGATPLAGGFGTNTSEFTFTVTAPGVIYYVCDNHVGGGMKGLITVNPVGLEELAASIQVNFGALPVTDGTLDYRIEAPENLLYSISVINVSGQEVATQLIESSEGRLPLNVVAGVYIVMLKTEDGTPLFRESISVR